MIKNIIFFFINQIDCVYIFNQILIYSLLLYRHKDKTKTGNSFARFLLKKKSKHSSSGIQRITSLYLYNI